MLRWLLIGPFVLVVVLFALSNTSPVALRLWPFDLAWQVSLSLAVLIIAGVFFLLGALIAWFGSMPARARARDLRGQVQVQEAEITRLRAELEAMRPPGENGTSRALRSVA
ncbi:MAG: LapA family protein [Pseudomonadota bacterium]